MISSRSRPACGLRPSGFAPTGPVGGWKRCRPPRKRVDMLLVERGLFESRARAQRGNRGRPCCRQRQADRKTLRDHSVRRRAAGAAGASLCLARRREARGRAGALSDRYRRPCLPRCRRLHRRLHRSAARQWRRPGLRSRCRPRPAASIAARPSQDRLDGADRHPQISRASACPSGPISSPSTSASSRSSSCCPSRCRLPPRRCICWR